MMKGLGVFGSKNKGGRIRFYSENTSFIENDLGSSSMNDSSVNDPSLSPQKLS